MGRLNAISYFLYFYHDRDFLAKNAHTLALSVHLNISEMEVSLVVWSLHQKRQKLEVRKKSKIPLTKTSFRFRMNS